MNLIKVAYKLYLSYALKREQKRCTKLPWKYPSFRRVKRIATLIEEVNKITGLSLTDISSVIDSSITNDNYSITFTFDKDYYIFYKMKVNDQSYDILLDIEHHPVEFNRKIAIVLYSYIVKLSSTES